MPSNPISRRNFFTKAGAAGAVIAMSTTALTRVATAAGRESLPPDESSLPFNDWIRSGDIPDPQHLRRVGRGWIVRPNGTDDHDNLEFALRNTASRGVVRLVRGTYKVGRPIVVPDFDGTLRGAGKRRTTITCTDTLNVELWEAPGGGKEQGEPKPEPFPRAEVNGADTKTPASVLVFYKTPLQPDERPGKRANKISVRRLRYRGSSIGESSVFGDETAFISISNSIDWNDPESAPPTTRQDVSVVGVEVDGYSSPEFGPLENACSCIAILGGFVATADYDLEGSVDGDALGSINGGVLRFTPAEGRVKINSCVFRNCRNGPLVIGYGKHRISLRNLETDGCRNNCILIADISDAEVVVEDNDLRCDSILLPPETVGGETDIPSSLGCAVILQGLAATIGFPFNFHYGRLANNPAAHAAHPEAGPMGTWRPQGPPALPLPSKFRVVGNTCESSLTLNTYCLHFADLGNMVFRHASLELPWAIAGNTCVDSQTCIGLEHIADAHVRDNDCSSQAVGAELHNTTNVSVTSNSFQFPLGVGECEILELSLGDKKDLSRVIPGAGFCRQQD